MQVNMIQTQLASISSSKLTCVAAAQSEPSRRGRKRASQAGQPAGIRMGPGGMFRAEPLIRAEAPKMTCSAQVHADS